MTAAAWAKASAETGSLTLCHETPISWLRLDDHCMMTTPMAP